MFALAALLGCGARPAVDVLIVTLDTTRVDHLSCYGYERETSPRLDRFAAGAVRFERAWSTSAWTLPAHASLFTGLYPATHGAQFDVRGRRLQKGFRARALDDRFTTLAELLAERGYRTAAFVGGPWLERGFGALQGFGHIDDAVANPSGRPGDELTDRALAWLGAAGGDPLFLFVNYFDPHFPYEPPAGYDTFPHARDPVPEGWLPAALGGAPVDGAVIDALVARYDGEIRFMDHQLGRLLDAWDARGSESLVIVTSDHGESFGEGGFYLHNGSLGEEAIRVPLLIRYPDGRGAGTADETPVQLVDVVPIVATALGVEAPPDVQGVLPGERRRAFLELLRNPFRVRAYGARYARDLEALVDWPHKLVVANGRDAALYRIDALPERPAASGDADVDALLAQLAAHREERGRAVDVRHSDVKPETAEALRALGYLE